MNNDHTWNNYEYNGSYTMAQPPNVVGWWLLYPQASPYNQFAMYHKPTDEQIKNTEQLLGWGWKDAT